MASRKQKSKADKKAIREIQKPVVEDVEVDVEETDAETEATAGGNVVPPKYRKKYGKTGNCGDAYAEAFAEIKTREELIEVAIENGIDPKRWAGRNNGMYRMNLGNVLRGMRKKQNVTIAGVVFKMVKEEAKADKKK